jgi:anti-sigma regulatory factor (Ser/Thr protein kinase)/ActR/RegA family two-component response regulator
MGNMLLIDSGGGFARTLMASPALKGHRFDHCGGNIEALLNLRAHAVDVIVTDPATSMAESLAMVDEFSRVRPGVRMIVLAPVATPEEIIAALREQTFACFAAPFLLDDVMEMIRLAMHAPEWRSGIEVVSGLPHWFTMRVSCHLLTAERLVRFMTEYQSALPDAERDLLIAAFREMLLNAREHGAGFDANKTIEVTAAKTERAIVYHFRDPGTGFDREDLSHTARSSHRNQVLAAARLRAERGLRPGGFGMLIARQIADALVYNERGDEVLLIKHLR